jgi:hypothetical protein
MRAGLALIEASVCARNATTMSPKYCSEPPHASQAAVAPRSRCTRCRSVEQAKLSVTWLEVIASAGFVFHAPVARQLCRQHLQLALQD